MPTPSPIQLGRSAIGFLVVLTVAIAAAYVVSERTAPVFVNAKARRAVLAEAGVYTTGSFGQSQAEALSMESLGRRAFHFWEPGSDLFENVRMLEYAKRRMPSLDEVFLTISPIQSDNGFVPERQERRKAVYYETTTVRPISGDWRQGLIAHVTPIARPDSWRGVLVGPHPEPIVMRPNGWIERKHRIIPLDSLDPTGPRNARLHMDLFQATRARKPEFCTEVRDALQAFVEAAGPGTRVVLYSPPFYQSYRASIPDPVPCDPLGTAESIADAFPNVVYLNYLDDPISQDRTLFRDTNHLNDNGTSVFSAKVRRDLAALGAAEPLR